MKNEHLARLLDDGQHFSPSYGGGLSNHLPMTLIALSALGGDDAAREAHVQRYAKRLEPLHEADIHIDAARFDRHLGDWSAHAAYRRFFSEALTEHGTDATLAAWWPELAPGLAAAGFHGLIRLAYGLEAESRTEIATGLAYLASAHTPLIDRASSVAAGAADLAGALAELRTAFAGNRIEAGLIIEELRLATEEPEFFPHLKLPRLESAPDCSTVRADFARVSVRLYLAAPSFNSLHLVTGTHALESVMDRLPAAMHTRTLAHFWVAFCAAYVSIGAPEPATAPADDPAPDWQPCIAAALKSPNDHLIKMVHTCKAQFARHGDAAYAVAAKKVCGIP
ncbi:MAG: questin oxidase family protein [Betaproteobacteria bacterium]|nr:questin oxidase family protein [Betaproteobacteria bacterium]